MIRFYKILMQEELSPEEKIRNKTIPRKKEIEFFLIFSTIRKVINGMSNYRTRESITKIEPGCLFFKT